MIKLTYKELRDPRFVQAVNKLYRSKMGIRAAKKAKEICNELDKELQLANELFNKFAADHLIAQENGMFQMREGEEHKLAGEEFNATPVEIQKPKLQFSELFHVELSPEELELLGGLIGDENV